MLLGILSDTHNRLDAMKAAVKLLRGAGAEYLIHCGDVGTEQIIDQLTGIPSALVWGNNDFDRPQLARYAESVGVKCLDRFGELTLDGKHIAVTHGDDHVLMKRLTLSQSHDYVLSGHTHVKSDRREKSTRLINPGALYRASVKTVATLDLLRDELKFLMVSLEPA
jgi:putative phosphoesterase